MSVLEDRPTDMVLQGVLRPSYVAVPDVPPRTASKAENCCQVAHFHTSLKTLDRLIHAVGSLAGHDFIECNLIDISDGSLGPLPS